LHNFRDPRLSAGAVVKPHSHPENRVYTVISGIFYIGFGDTFDFKQLRAYPAGALVFVPGGASHFHAATSGEWVVQINSVGPTAFKYVRDTDDPRH
jgi:quercetin dioxygenase-like cupin family protein